MNSGNIVLAFVALAHSALVQADQGKEFTREIANDVAVYAMMASNAYRRDDERVKFPVESMGWTRVPFREEKLNEDDNSYKSKTFIGSIFSNLQFDIWEDEKEKRAVIAIKGTDEKVDWLVGDLSIGVAIPYKTAKKRIGEYMERRKGWKVVVVGHSLGGGVALSTSLWLGVEAVAFNSTPRLFDGHEDHNEPAVRLMIYQEGEIVQRIRKWYPKLLERIPPEAIVETKFDYHGVNKHRMDMLAQGILACATTDELKSLAGKVKLTVTCPLP